MKANVRNPALFESVKAFIFSATQLIIRHLEKGEEIPSSTVEKTRIRKNSCSTYYATQLEPTFLIYKHEKQIQQLPEYARCIEVMESDSEIFAQLNTPIGTSQFRCGISAWNYLANILEKQFYKSLRKWKFNLKIFKKAYSDFEYFLYHETIPTIAIAPLHNFNSEANRIDLGEGLIIRKITRQEKTEIFEAYGISKFPNYELLGLKYVMEFCYQSKKLFGPLELKRIDDEINPFEKIDKLLISLRLHKANSIGISVIKIQYQLDIPFVKGMTTSRPVHGVYHGNEYCLKKTEINNFKRFWRTTGNKEFEGLAIRRFNFAYGRENLEDKLIDIMIALEALFLKGEKGGAPSGIIISVACSALIGKNQAERERIKVTLMEAYKIRNSIVHGSNYERYKTDNKTKVKKDLLVTLVSDVENYLREAIKKMLG